MTAGESSIALTRLAEERKQWRKDHPFGFYARPQTNSDGSLNLMSWECGIPGKTGSPWEGGLYKLTIKFSNDYPMRAPACNFTPPLPHPNIFPSGAVCLSILNADWRPSINLKQILLGIQDLFDNPNPKSPANSDAYHLYRESKKRYEENVRKFAQRMKPVEAEEVL